MLIWVVASVTFALVVGVAAFAASAAAAATRCQSRLLWVIAIAVSAGWPLLASLVLNPQISAQQTLTINGASAGAVHALATQLPSLSTQLASRVDQALITGWCLATLARLMRLLRAQRLLTKLTSTSRVITLDGNRVLVSDELGPAAVGVINPRIVVPSWIADLDASLRAMILRHERSHCSARDSSLLWFAELTIAAMPWNPALWWQARRLRLAIEMDCDLRTLRTAADQTMYAQLLVLIAHRLALYPQVPMIAAFDSHLQQRIIAMRRPIASFTSPRVILFGGLAIAVALVACSPVFRNDVAGISASNRRNSAVYTESQVATTAQVLPDAKFPEYPAELRTAGIEGELVAAFVVDTAGRVEEATFKATNSTDQRFADAVKAALTGFRFSPARLADGRKVRQQVVQPFLFALDTKK